MTLADGTVVRADRVLICAGVQTPALFGPLGIEFAPHIRVHLPGLRRHRRRVPVRARGLRAAARQHGALGVRQELPDPATVRALFPSLCPVGQVDCVTVRAPWLDAGGDGWTAARRGCVVALVGSNLMSSGRCSATGSLRPR